MTLVPANLPEYNNPERLLTPTETCEYVRWRYGITIRLASLYSMINRGDSPKVTYFRNRPKFLIPDIDEWVRRNRSDKRKNGGV
jgi:hypothetical protein